MGLFINRVAVNLEDVTKFRERVETFAQVGYTAANDMLDTLAEMEAYAERCAHEMEQIAHANQALYSSIKQAEGQVAQRISSLKSRLANTPKELEKETLDKEGNSKVVKEPNPAYRELQAQIQKENARLSKLKDLAWKVYNEASYSKRVSEELISSLYELKNIIPEMQSVGNDMVSKAQRALDSLEKTIRAIGQYVSFRFHI